VKSTSPKKLKNLIEFNDLVIVQWGNERCVPCKRQEFAIDEICDTFSGIKCVKIDIDDYAKHRKQFKIKDLYPAVSVYKFGEPQEFKDSKIGGKTTNVIYGERDNIKIIVKSIAHNML